MCSALTLQTEALRADLFHRGHQLHPETQLPVALLRRVLQAVPGHDGAGCHCHIGSDVADSVRLLREGRNLCGKNISSGSDSGPSGAGGRSSFQVAATREPTDGSAVSQRLLQLVDERRRGADDRTNQLALFRKSEVEGNLCRKNQTCYAQRPTPPLGLGPTPPTPTPRSRFTQTKPVLPPELSLRLRSLSPSGSGPAPSEATSTSFA